MGRNQKEIIVKNGNYQIRDVVFKKWLPKRMDYPLLNITEASLRAKIIP